MDNFEQIALDVAELVAKKNVAYGDSFSRSGEVLRQMYPLGVSPCEFDDLLFVVRVLDKLFRIAAQPGAFGESPYLDIMGYGLLAERRHRESRGGPEKGDAGAEEGGEARALPGYGGAMYHPEM